MNAISNSINRFKIRADAYMKDAVPVTVPIGNIVPYRKQIRTTFDPVTLQELADSIARLGLQQPILIRPLGEDKYEIVAGERRWRAAQLAGLTEISALVKALDDETIDAIHIAENIHRDNLETVEWAARVVKDLAEGATVDSLTVKFQKSKGWISRLVSLGNRGEVTQSLIDENVTPDSAILASVASLERKDKAAAMRLVEKITTGQEKDKREVVAEFMKKRKTIEKKKSPVKSQKQKQEPDWREAAGVAVSPEKLPFIKLEMAPKASYIEEFTELSHKHGDPHLATGVRHPDGRFAMVSFGKGKETRSYRAEDLRLIFVGEPK